MEAGAIVKHLMNTKVCKRICAEKWLAANSGNIIYMLPYAAKAFSGSEGVLDTKRAKSVCAIANHCSVR